MDEARWYRLRVLAAMMGDYELTLRQRREAAAEYDLLVKKKT